MALIRVEKDFSAPPTSESMDYEDYITDDSNAGRESIIRSADDSDAYGSASYSTSPSATSIDDDPYADVAAQFESDEPKSMADLRRHAETRDLVRRNRPSRNRTSVPPSSSTSDAEQEALPFEPFTPYAEIEHYEEIEPLAPYEVLLEDDDDDEWRSSSASSSRSSRGEGRWDDRREDRREDWREDRGEDRRRGGAATRCWADIRAAARKSPARDGDGARSRRGQRASSRESSLDALDARRARDGAEPPRQSRSWADLRAAANK